MEQRSGRCSYRPRCAADAGSPRELGEACPQILPPGRRGSPPCQHPDLDLSLQELGRQGGSPPGGATPANSTISGLQTVSSNFCC